MQLIDAIKYICERICFGVLWVNKTCGNILWVHIIIILSTIRVLLKSKKDDVCIHVIVLYFLSCIGLGIEISRIVFT